jgi:hypothetical protein
VFSHHDLNKGGSLSLLPFNLTLEYAIKKIHDIGMNSDWNTSDSGDTDVLNLVGEERNTINEDTKPLLDSRKRDNLQIKAL